VTAIELVAAQIGSSIMPDNKVWHNRFTVSSQTSSAVYTVAQRNTDDTWGCSCRGWIHHRHCKHLTDILSRLSALYAAQPVLLSLNPHVRQILSSARMAYLDLEVTPLHRESQRNTRKLDL
jgi:hypothetical protein